MPTSYSLKVESPSIRNDGRVSNMANLRKASFVPYPEGNGKCRHGLWERLYMGAVPVVAKSSYLDPIYFESPLVKFDSWSNLLNTRTVERK